jgi:hypothetical protein
MHFEATAVPSEMVSLFHKFVAITGWDHWKARLALDLSSAVWSQRSWKRHIVYQDRKSLLVTSFQKPTGVGGQNQQSVQNSLIPFYTAVRVEN